jgi:hypothetical protein
VPHFLAYRIHCAEKLLQAGNQVGVT